MATPLNYVPSDVPLTLLVGDDIQIGITIKADITGRVYSAGFTDGKNMVLAPIECTVTDDGSTTSLGKIVVSITKANWTTIKTAIKNQTDLHWFFTQAISNKDKTLMQGKVTLRYK